MEFPEYDFNSMGEADVREEIIAPLLRHLGYRSGTNNNVIREQQLTYSKLSLGRKKNTDPYLRGKADYICEAGGLVRWVIEAKAPGEALNSAMEEQAWSYAVHPEIRAIYFVLTNGRQFRLYQTNHGPDAPALFECTYEELPTKLAAIEGVLSPMAILRDHSSAVIDTGTPIGPGLRSIVRVASGYFRYTRLSVPIPPLQEMIMTVVDGSVERGEDGKLEAHLRTRAPFQSLQKLNKKLGLDQVWFVSASTTVSANAAQPTIFDSKMQTILPKGLVALNLTTWKEVEFPMNVTVDAVTRATGYLTGATFTGDFFASMTYKEFAMNVTLNGVFELQLA